MGGQLGGVPGQGEEGAQRSDYDAGDEQGDRGSQPAWLSGSCLRTPYPTSGWMCTSWGCHVFSARRVSRRFRLLPGVSSSKMSPGRRGGIGTVPPVDQVEIAPGRPVAAGGHLSPPGQARCDWPLIHVEVDGRRGSQPAQSVRTNPLLAPSAVGRTRPPGRSTAARGRTPPNPAPCGGLVADRLFSRGLAASSRTPVRATGPGPRRTPSGRTRGDLLALAEPVRCTR
jgi:hypothetical protein